KPDSPGRVDYGTAKADGEHGGWRGRVSCGWTEGDKQDLSYALGYASNPVLQRATEHALADVELYHHFYGQREPVVQRFESLADYQADSWPHPRRIVAKIEVTPVGSQRRFVVTNLADEASVVYRDFYV